MKYILAFLLLTSCLAAPALADTLKIPVDKPVASINFPEGWKASLTGEAIAASNENGDVLIDVIMTRPDMLGPSNDKAFALLKVKPEFDSFKEKKSTQNGMNVNEVTVDGKDASGRTVKLTLMSFEVTKEKGVMFIIRGGGVEENHEDIEAILGSVAAAK